MASDDALLRDFWRCFTHTATTHSCVLKLFVQRLPEGAKILRAVNSTMRVAVNRTVTALRYAQSYILPDNDLAEVFPEVDELDCAFAEPVAGTGAPPLIEHMRLALDRFAAASPRFVRKIRVLKMRFHDSHTANVPELLAELLPRYVARLWCCCVMAHGNHAECGVCNNDEPRLGVLGPHGATPHPVPCSVDTGHAYRAFHMLQCHE
jgi:hypothetical protein